MAGSQRVADLVDRVIDRALAAGTVVGTVVLSRAAGAPIYARAAGYADREAGKRTELDTVFRLASLTKPLVAAVALRLVEMGRLSLDDEVVRYLPEFLPRLETGQIADIRVRHLLTHTAGFGYPEAPPDDHNADGGLGERYWAAQASNGLDQPGLTLDENLQRVASVPLYFRPGSAWRYGVATDVLGAVIAAVHGGSLAEAVSELVTNRLNMTDTAFNVRHPDRLAVPYADGVPRAERMREPQTLQGFVLSPARAFDDRSFQSGGAGMVGTAGDFMIFLEAIRTGGTPVLRPETVADAASNHVGHMRHEDEPGWGFGFLSAVLFDPAAARSPQGAGTLSWGGVWGNTWFIDPGASLSAAIFTNTAFEGCTGQFPLDVRDALYAACPDA